MGAPLARFLAVLLAAAAGPALAAPIHTVLLTPSTPSPSLLSVSAGDTVNFTLQARPAARVVQSVARAPCTPRDGGFARTLDAERPSFVLDVAASTPIWFYVVGECEIRPHRLARRAKDLDWAQLWGIVLGIAFGLVALAAVACCSWCCCFQKRMRRRQARLHVRDEGVQTAAAALELPTYERRVRAGEVQLEEAPAPDYHLPHSIAAEDVPLPPSPGAALPAAPPPALTRHPSSPPPPADLPPAYSHAPP
ncbi:hypothetical protein AURDEDRAFT_143745 [Auricularia subglabra TFB-10046 SS5]|nr:hypothetical protein AURDEDRAFT_143745 [Auricularia subglabra TFB-10046 SS5]